MNFNFAWFEDFLALASTGNFSRAAEQRHSSQPAFSRRVRALEEWVGAPLVDRSTQPAQLTEVGGWLEGVARDLVARTACLPGEARRLSEERAGTLRIACTHALSFTFLPGWLRNLEERLRIGPIALTSDVLAHCEAQMQQGKVHFVLTHAHPRVVSELDKNAFTSTLVGHDKLFPVSCPSGDRRPLHRLPKDSPGQVPVLGYTEQSGLGRVMRSILASKLDTPGARVVLTAHLASVLRSMALDGRGVAWLPRTLIAGDIAAGRLLPAGDEDWAVPLEIRLYRRKERVGSAAEAFWRAAAATPMPQGATSSRAKQRNSDTALRRRRDLG